MMPTTSPLHPEVHAALVTLQTLREDMVGPERPTMSSERGGRLSLATVRLWFHRLYTSLAITQRYIEGDIEAKRKLVALI